MRISKCCRVFSVTEIPGLKNLKGRRHFDGSELFMQRFDFDVKSILCCVYEFFHEKHLQRWGVKTCRVTALQKNCNIIDGRVWIPVMPSISHAAFTLICVLPTDWKETVSVGVHIKNMKHQPGADISSYTRRCPPPHELFLHFHLRGLSEMRQKLLTLRAAADIFYWKCESSQFYLCIKSPRGAKVIHATQHRLSSEPKREMSAQWEDRNRLQPASLHRLGQLLCAALSNKRL